MMVGAASDQSAQVSFDLALGQGTDKFVYLPALVEEEKGGDTLDTILRSRERILIKAVAHEGGRDLPRVIEANVPPKHKVEKRRKRTPMLLIKAG